MLKMRTALALKSFESAPLTDAFLATLAFFPLLRIVKADQTHF
jgi:hypothetical protein